MNAVITGGTKGIGKSIANLLYSKGLNISICSRHESDLALMRKEMSQIDGGDVHTSVVDVSKKDEVVRYAQEISQRLGRIDVIINNAGVFLPGEIHNEEEGTLEKMINTNLYSAYHLTRALLPEMLEYGSGHVFNICSVASIKAYPNGGSYSISKFALLGFSKCLREELKDKGIKVTSILPGATWSHSWQGVDLPVERLMQSEDIAKAVWSTMEMGPSAVVEEIIIRPQLGDL